MQEFLPSPRPLLRARLVVTVLTALALLLAGTSASAATIIRLSGSGLAEVTAGGTIYLDGNDTVFGDLSLTAQSIVIGGDEVAGVPGDDWNELLIGDPADLAGIEFIGDVLLDLSGFAGSASLEALEIHVIGDLEVEGLLSLNLTDDGNGSGDPCGDGGGVVISSSAGGLEIPCVDPGDGEVLPDPGAGLPGDGGIIVPGTPVPEPTAALVFGLGLSVVALRLRRRA